MASLKHEAVTSSWNTLVIQGAGKDKWVRDRVEQMIKDARMPGVITGQQEVSSGMFGAKRKFLVVNHQNLRDYRMYIGARDFGENLDVSWYLTIQPGAFKRMFSKYSTGNPHALSQQVDFFSQQDLSAYTDALDYPPEKVKQPFSDNLIVMVGVRSSMSHKRGFTACL